MQYSMLTPFMQIPKSTSEPSSQRCWDLLSHSIALRFLPSELLIITSETKKNPSTGDVPRKKLKGPRKSTLVARKGEACKDVLQTRNNVENIVEKGKGCGNMRLHSMVVGYNLDFPIRQPENLVKGKSESCLVKRFQKGEDEAVVGPRSSLSLGMWYLKFNAAILSTSETCCAAQRSAAQRALPANVVRALHTLQLRGHKPTIGRLELILVI